MATGILAGAAVVSAGLGIFGAVKGSRSSAPTPQPMPAAPEVAPPPPPASYYSYDEDGNPAGSQVWDAAQNAYIYRPAALTPEQQKLRTEKNNLKTQMLGNLNQTPADRVKAYEDYAKAISEGMHRDVDYQFNKSVTAQNEGMASRGMFGSRAYVDAQAELNRTKTLADTDIANKAQLGKENLANQDRNFWLQTLSSLDQDSNAQATIAQGNMRNLQTGAGAATADLLGGYNAFNASRNAQWQTQVDYAKSLNNNNLERWATGIAQNNNLSNTMQNTASGLAFLYGYKTGGGGGGGKSGSLSGREFMTGG